MRPKIRNAALLLNRMPATRHLLPMAAILVAGCASVPRTNGPADDSQEQAQVQQTLYQIFDAAEKKDFNRVDGYHLYGPKFTKFAPEQPGRQDAAASRQGEHDGLSAINGLSMHANELKIDLFGDVAIATFIVDSHFKSGADTVERKARSTLVFVKDHGAWKIAHEHFSPLKPATP